jgi:hypothetical protein
MMMQRVIDVRTLRDGGQPASTVAAWVADFVAGARRSLDVAQYDFHLQPDTAAAVGGALRDGAARGVAVRFVYNVDHRNPIPVPPPPEPDAQLIASLGVPAKPIAGVPDLMHYKYVVRDGEAVWDRFDELDGRLVLDPGEHHRRRPLSRGCRSLQRRLRAALDDGSRRTQRVRRAGATDRRRNAGATWFTPGYGDSLSARIATQIARARFRVRICSPVMTAAPVLATLA